MSFLIEMAGFSMRTINLLLLFHLGEIRSRAGFQLRNPYPDLMDCYFTVRLGNPKKECKSILVNSGLLFANYACACKAAVLKKQFFKSFKKKERKETQEQISQR